eukprot:TRINITY_DN9011_c0_g1_i1.p1 TRINITY_DN9011_c0_g1~~TRINITY_DN9011_c0_g1_i1.p1  ORF type:complete len:125 (+),score=11.35 TRINITY_DN9011_c0_g1_i1:48-422(+)
MTCVSTHWSSRSCGSLDMVKDLVCHAVVLAHHHFLELPLAVTFSIRSAGDPHLTIVVLRQPSRAGGEALRADVVDGVLVLLTGLQVWSMVLREVREELRAVGEAHGASDASASRYVTSSSEPNA